MSEEKIHAICKICPGEFTGCEMDKPDCWIVQGSFALDQVKSLEAERDQLKGKVKTGDDFFKIDEQLIKNLNEYISKLESRLAEADLQGKVRDFHLKFNFTANPINEKPTLIPIGLAMKRLKFLRKEVDELEEAEQLGDMVKIADALGDILYFVYGNAVAYGIPMIPVFNEIHRSNMTKSPCLDKDGKATKGEGYSPPDIVKALRGVVGNEV